MRINNSLKNFTSSVGINIVGNLLSFISRTIFISVLGSAYLGVNGLLSNVLSMLSLAELGIGSAINFSLYKPIAGKDDKKILALMNFYKIAYRFIGILVFWVGLVIMLFLDVIIKDSGEIKNLKLIFLIYLINISYSYFFSYKTTLLNADQKGYLLTKTNIIFDFINVIFQMVILVITKSFIAYLITNMIVLFIQRLYINRKITELYPILNFNKKEKLPKEELKKIIKNVKAMMFHKIGDYCINGTDNIIISTFISISIVGIYSNYAMLISMVNGILVMFFGSITASMGNLIAEGNSKRKIEVFNIINFIGFWLFGFATVCLYNLLNPFIELWLGKDFLISQGIIIIILMNYYLTGMRVPVSTVKIAAGLYDEDKFTPIIQSVVNLGLSIILVQKWGLAGVFMGTLISSVVLPCWQRPMIVCRYALETSSKAYFKKYIKYILVVIFSGFLTSFIISKLFIDVTILNFLLRMLICTITPNLIFFIFFKNSFEFNEIIKILNKIIGGRVKWIKELV